MTAVDGTGLSAIEELADELRAKGRTLVICGAPAQPRRRHAQGASFIATLGDENICASVQAALDRAAGDRAADAQRAREQRVDRNDAAEPVTADGRESGRRHAAAIRAVGRAAELARRDRASSGPPTRTPSSARRCSRLAMPADRGTRRATGRGICSFGKPFAQLASRVDDALAIGGGQLLRDSSPICGV